MNEEKIKEVFSDEAFVKSLMELENPEEVQDALAEKDIDLSTDEIKSIAELLQKKAGGELTDEELDSVAGGSIGIALLVGLTAVTILSPIAAEVHQATRRRW